MKANKKGFFHPINYDRALLCAISHKIMVHKNKRIKRKICFGQAVAVHGPLVLYIAAVSDRNIRNVLSKLAQDPTTFQSILVLFHFCLS